MNKIKDMIRRWLLDSQPEEPKLRGLNIEERQPTTMIRTFTISEAMNGAYISFTRRKYNPHAADDYRNEVYLVQSGESLIDAISTVLVLTEK
jgi:hypothetical protein